jgi:hypothetical protein
MTRERYFTMCEQMGKEPDDEEIPPDWQDFPDIAIYATNTYNLLGDRIYPDIGYVGKDYSNLSVFIDMYEIEDKELFVEILDFLDSRAIKKSHEQMKRHHDKLKRQK